MNLISKKPRILCLYLLNVPHFNAKFRNIWFSLCYDCIHIELYKTTKWLLKFWGDKWHVIPPFAKHWGRVYCLRPHPRIYAAGLKKLLISCTSMWLSELHLVALTISGLQYVTWLCYHFLFQWCLWCWCWLWRPRLRIRWQSATPALLLSTSWTTWLWHLRPVGRHLQGTKCDRTCCPKTETGVRGLCAEGDQEKGV